MESSEVKEQVERICHSSEFRTKALMQKFLTYLVDESLEGRSDQIKGYSIAIDVFNQGEKFDPDQNALVRINAGRLRRLLKVYYLEEGVNDPIYIDIPKGQYVPRINIKKNEDNEVLVAQSKVVQAEESMQSSIAVFPFGNFSNNDQLEYFSYGFPQELSSALTKFDDLRVVGNSSLSEVDKNDKAFYKQIRNRGIRFILDGDFMSAGNQVKLSVRLIDLLDDVQVWGENYKFELETDNLFEIEEKITKFIAGHIGGEYGYINRKRSQNLDLDSVENLNLSEQIIMLKYYHYQTQLTLESGQDLYEHVSKALEKFPDSGILHAIIANLYGNIYAMDLPGAQEAYELFGEHAEKGFALDPKNDFTKGVLAFKCFMYNEKERFFHIGNKSVNRVANSPMRLGVFAIFYSLFGEWEKGMELMDRILENNLEVPLYLYGVTSIYYYKDFNYEAALAEAGHYQVPQSFWGPMLRVAALGQLDRIKEAGKHISDLITMRPDFNEKATYLLSRYIKEDSIVEHLKEGLIKAGMKIV
jgi:TolB-like protein